MTDFNLQGTSLKEIGKRFGTDKATRHNYCDVYEPLFESKRDEKIALLEIGAGPTGASHKMWKEYFSQGEVYCMEAFYGGEYTVKSSILEECGVHALVGNQLKREDLLRVGSALAGELYDIIIDDGAHMFDAIQLSLGVLFPYLKSGGLYVVEDLHAARKRGGKYTNEKYKDSTLQNTNEHVKPYGPSGEIVQHVNDYTLLESFEVLEVTRQWPSFVLSPVESNYLAKHILEYQFYDDMANLDVHGDNVPCELCVIRKK